MNSECTENNIQAIQASWVCFIWPKNWSLNSWSRMQYCTCLPDHILATSSKQGAIQSQTTSITAAIGNDITQQRGTVFQVHSFILLTSTQRSVAKLTRSSTPPTLVILGRMLSEQCAPYFYWFLTLAHSINFVHSGGKTIYVFGTLIQRGQCNLGS